MPQLQPPPSTTAITFSHNLAGTPTSDHHYNSRLLRRAIIFVVCNNPKQHSTSSSSHLLLPPSSHYRNTPRLHHLCTSSSSPERLLYVVPSLEMQPPLLPLEFAPASATTGLCRFVFSVHSATTTMTAPRS
ncbi:hypothetical protein DEO72_LG4g975 [Vigna unguiculata]|uniref:Uncharacterized protein n=1 Tax=Vigna unguiculata TaxID=3917 RepID=A0A4D6LNG3_VIGUN|nr:hypothetical protein DEO72_LG4g975 [Vigna unguiculata]